MLIFKRSFSDYMSEKLSEMAIPPTTEPKPSLERKHRSFDHIQGSSDDGEKLTGSGAKTKTVHVLLGFHQTTYSSYLPTTFLNSS